MRAILPGRPQSSRQAVCTAQWDGLRLVAYLSGNTVIVLRDPKNIVQTITIDHVEELTAITIQESTGRIATCNENRVLIFDAVDRDVGDLRWRQTLDFALPEDGVARSISWGLQEELLVGGSQLWLYHLPHSEDPRLIWQQPVANEIVVSSFSDDAELIASCGHHDKLVKIWRRLSFEYDSTRFDVTYLPHPAAVTDLHWRKPWHEEQNLDSLLYTFCADNQVRVWSYSDPHSLSIVQLLTTIDTNASIEPRRRSVGSMSRKRFVFILDSRDFSQATEKAIQESHHQRVDHALEHLIEIANRSPELCVVLDGLGHMSVWGLENAGYKSKKPIEVFNVTLVDDVDIQLNFKHGGYEDYTRIHAFGGGPTAACLSLLVHSYTGQVDWYESPITRFFETTSRKDRVRLLSCWSGHDLSIDHLARGFRGNRILSWTDGGKAILWAQNDIGALRRQSEVDTRLDVLSVILFDLWGHLLVLHRNSISLWDIRYSHAVSVHTVSFGPTTIAKSLQRVGSVIGTSRRAVFVVSFDDGMQEMWQVQLALEKEQTPKCNGSVTILKKMHTIENSKRKNTFFMPCDSASGRREASVESPEIRRAHIDSDGRVDVFSTSLDRSSSKEYPECIFSFDTMTQNPSIARTSSSGKCAIVTTDRKNIGIWDLSQGFCEWQYTYGGHDEIKKLAWSSTTSGNSFLFIGFSYHAMVIGQFRYPTSSHLQSAWYVTQNISLRDFTTIQIGDVSWLSSGDVAISAGNQIFVLENLVTESGYLMVKKSAGPTKSESAAAVIDMANSVLPIFHPDFLEALMFEHGLDVVQKILQELYTQLTYFSEGDELASDLGLSALSLLSHGDRAIDNGTVQVNGDTDASSVRLEDVEESFLEYLDQADIWQLGPKKRQKLALVLTNVVKVGKYQNSLDENALRYLYALYNTPLDRDLKWSAFVLASRSTFHEALIELIVQHHHGKLTWQVARRTGLFIWLEDKSALQTHFESVARAEYTKHEDRNPVDCSLYYLALNKKAVLQSLWRMTYGIREKENTMKLLSNDFDQPKWKAAALKNAYALISKRRFEYAAAFFLLGGSLRDAVNVCINQLNDTQLAVAITRVWDKDNDQSAKIFQDILRNTILPMSVNHTQGRWIAAWAYTSLNQPTNAIQSLIRPLHHLISTDFTTHSCPLKSMFFLAENPHLATLYLQLRNSLIAQNNWDTSVLSQQEEWTFVLNAAKWWSRAGMPDLSLSLLKTWQFIPHQQPRQAVAATTLTVRAEEAATPAVEQEQVNTAKKKPPPTQFVEPSSDSLLDSFGF